jgi:glycerophosphoryl diester phosphodiesterase
MTDPFLNQTGTTAAGTTTKTTPSWLTTTLDTLKYGVGVYTDAQKRQAEADTAAAALKLENLKLQALKEQKAIVDSNNAAKPSLIKSYGLPIAITGVVVALGIGTYFYFKKKKA